MEPPATRYARAPDGVSLAFHTVGDGAIDMLWFHAFMGSLEVMLEHPVMRSLTDRLTSYARVIRHDMRATGLSGRARASPIWRRRYRMPPSCSTRPARVRP